MLPLARPNLDREELFISRYMSLRDQAMRLTDRNSNEAEDLLHDAFIHFTLSQTPVENIQNLDGYLYTMLRNLRLSQARRLARTPLGHLSVIDYDSAEAGLNSTDPRDRIKVQDELRAICQYACVRKGTSKTGSVLILRFFHGYFPNEIAQILRSPRSAVDNLLQTARREARLFKTDPDALAFLHTDRSVSSPQFSFGQLSTDILSEVREAIFQQPGSDCPKANIKDLYHLAESDSNQTEGDNPSEKPIDAAYLAHLVGCRSCLDHVNELLGLPPLASRLTTDETKATDKKPKSGGGIGGGMGLSSTDTFLKRSRKRVKQVFEHQPEELLISVNGFIIGSQRINSEMNELALSVNLDEKIGFIEVFSERDVCLLFQSVEPPPDGSAVQPARVELSGGRVLELSLDFSDTWPQLNASYRDPSFKEARAHSEVSEPGAVVTGEILSAPPAVAGGVIHRLLQSIGRIDWRQWLQPARLTAAFAVLLIAALVVWKTRDASVPVTATDLLVRAVTNEQQAAAATDVVFHKTINLEERNDQGTLLARRKIDTYQSGEQKLTVRRLYDEQGRLIAGEWKRGDGSRTLYSNKEKPKISTTSQSVSVPVSLEGAWLLEPSAQDFKNLTEQNAATITEETPTYYTVSYEPSATNQTSTRLINAKIVISKADLRAIDQTLLVQNGDQRREYRYTEASYQTLSPKSVAPAVFEPERELLASLLRDLKIKTDGEATTEPTDSANTATNTTTASPSATATADLEVEALNLLNQAGADTGEQVSVTKSGGVLRIDGIVDTEQRKNELIRGLSAIAGNPAVRINIMTVAEALQKQQSRNTKNKQTGNSSAERLDTSSGEVPAKDKLRSYFGSDEAANNFASRMIGRSRSAMSRAGAMKRLVGQFSLAELKELSPDARAKWLNLVRSHARAFQQETAALRQDLSPVFGGDGGGAPAPEINDDAALVRAVQRLFELGAANDRTVRTALSISTDTAGAGITPDFFRSLRTTEELAARIQAAR
jgi:RNA polymerase sigma factor (sigma-70 family)